MSVVIAIHPAEDRGPVPPDHLGPVGLGHDAVNYRRDLGTRRRSAFLGGILVAVEGADNVATVDPAGGEMMTALTALVCLVLAVGQAEGLRRPILLQRNAKSSVPRPSFRSRAA